MQLKTDYPVPALQEGQVLVKNTLSGVNFMDIYFRTGLYPSAKPEMLGWESLPPDVSLGPNAGEHGLKVGDRVIWLGNSGYSEYTAAPTLKTVKIPGGVSDEAAMATFMSG